MDKIEIYHYLKRQNIAYEITEHKAVFNMEEADAVDLPYPEWGAKNLFVRDDKKRNYYLITMKGNKRVDFKAFRRQRGLRALSFAAASELFSLNHQPASKRLLYYHLDEHQFYFRQIPRP